MSGILGILVKLLVATFEKIAVEAVFQEVMAQILEIVTKSSKTTADDKLIKPVIDHLRK